MRAVVEQYLADESKDNYKTAAGELGLLTDLIEAKMFKKEETYKLQLLAAGFLSMEHTPNSARAARGKYFVNCECLWHSSCQAVAPANFKYDTDAGFYYVSKQPENDLEERNLKEAIAVCPMDAVRDTGHQIDWDGFFKSKQ